MAKKPTPAASTPAQRYPDPYWAGASTGPSMGYPSPMVFTPGADEPLNFNPQGAMANTPKPAWGYGPSDVTPQANAVAARAYTRNAPYMEEFMASPQAMVEEMRRLQQALAEDPSDVVSEYRLRVLRQALGDVFGMGAPDQLDYDARAQGPTTPQGRNIGAMMTTPTGRR